MYLLRGKRVANPVALIAATMLAVAAVWTANSVMTRWVMADFGRQARVAIHTSETFMVDHLSTAGPALDSVLMRLSTDPQILGVAICTRGDLAALVAKSNLYDDRSLPCTDIAATYSRSAVGIRQASWLARMGDSELRVHVSAIPLGKPGSNAPLAVVIQRTEELANRVGQLQALVVGILLAIGGGAWWFAAAGRRRSVTEWVTGFRRALHDGEMTAEYRPLIAEMRDILRPSPSLAPDDALTGRWSRDRIRQLLTENMRGTQAIVLANREPYIHERDGNSIRVMRPASGVVTALDPVLRASSGTWIAHGGGSADRDTVDSHDRLRVPPGEESYTLRRIWLNQEEEQGYYYGFANEGIWPLCHLAHVRPSFRAGDWQQYEIVNRRFANAVTEEAEAEDPLVLIQDYHFSLAPAYVRQLLPRSTVITFWHIPWPNSERFGISPWREALLDGLLGSDILGFHTQAHCNYFMDAVDAYLEARVDRGDGTITRRGHTTIVRAYPISVEWPRSDVERPPPVAQCRERILHEYGLGPDTVLAVSVDRLDYTKGFVERMLAVEELLASHPELLGKFVLLQVAAPSRVKIPRYAELQTEVAETAGRINARFGRAGYQPVVLAVKHVTASRVLEIYRAADILYVSSIHDGMNLVAKEFAAARDDERGVLVLSQFTGASRELTEALIVNPYDTQGAATALAAAAYMSPDEQRARMRAMRTHLAEFNVYRWAGRMLSDAAALRMRVRPNMNKSPHGSKAEDTL